MDLIRKLEQGGAITRGSHIVLKSGRHSPDYIDFDHMFPDFGFMSLLGRSMAEELVGCGAQALIAPALGGAVLMQWVAMAMRRINGKNLRGYWAEKQENGSFSFVRADWEADLSGLAVAAIEDVTSTGGSVKRTNDAASKAGATVVLTVAAVNRGGVTSQDLGTEFRWLAEVDLPSYAVKDCPGCKEGLPIAYNKGHPENFPEYSGEYVKV